MPVSKGIVKWEIPNQSGGKETALSQRKASEGMLLQYRLGFMRIRLCLEGAHKNPLNENLSISFRNNLYF